MKITNIKQLEELNKIIPKKSDVNKWYSGSNYLNELKNTCNKQNINFDNCIIYVVNIFLDKEKNKYKNVKPIPCIVKFGSHFWDDDTNYCLITTENDIWDKYYRYDCIEKIDEIILKGEASDKGKPSYIHKLPYLKLFTTKKEAYEYIDKYKCNHDFEKYKEKLSRINKDIEILMKEKQRLENLIKEYESNT